MRRGKKKGEIVRYIRCVVCGKRKRTARGHATTCGATCRTRKSRRQLIFMGQLVPAVEVGGYETPTPAGMKLNTKKP